MTKAEFYNWLLIMFKNWDKVALTYTPVGLKINSGWKNTNNWIIITGDHDGACDVKTSWLQDEITTTYDGVKEMIEDKL